MNKFKVGDIVLAIADNSEFVNAEHGKLFKVTKLLSANPEDPAIEIVPDYNFRRKSPYSYYEYKFKKATKKEVTKFNFDWMVNKLKGVHVSE